MFKTAILISYATSFVTLSQAECPNACSNSGTCGPRDQCTCYKNFQGNDCSERTCPFGNAHVDTPKGDLDMNGAISFADNCESHQVYPNKVSELWNIGGEGEKGHADEAHYYMECSNAGLCDRSTGTCSCFDGYEGSSCQRLACSNSCSGHGTCESLKELSAKAAGTSLSFKADIAAANSYDLWDGRHYYGCKCDPGYFGHDCNQRRCDVGVDPMYMGAGEERIEHIRILVDRGADAAAVKGTYKSNFRIRFFDYWGQSFITNKISYSALGTAETAKNIAYALQALPNQVVKSVECTYASAASGWKIFTGISANFDNFYCKFTNNPGKLRLAEVVPGSVELYGDATDPAVAGTKITLTSLIGVFILPTPVSGEDIDLAGKLTTTQQLTSADKASNSGAGDTITLQAALSAYPALIKVGELYLIVTSATTLGHAYPDATAISAATKTFLSDATITATTKKLTTATLGSKDLTFETGHGLAVGETFFAYHILYTVTEVDGDGVTVTVDKPFGGTHTGESLTSGQLLVYKLPSSNPENTYEYVNECSNRGLCNRDSGVCECFTGYHSYNCDSQSHHAS
jgi:hypothetical protein